MHLGSKENIYSLEIKIRSFIGHTCRGLRGGASNLVLCPFCVVEGKVKSRPISDPDPRTIFATKKKMEIYNYKNNSTF